MVIAGGRSGGPPPRTTCSRRGSTTTSASSVDHTAAQRDPRPADRPRRAARPGPARDLRGGRSTRPPTSRTSPCTTSTTPGARSREPRVSGFALSSPPPLRHLRPGRSTPTATGTSSRPGADRFDIGLRRECSRRWIGSTLADSPGRKSSSRWATAERPRRGYLRVSQGQPRRSLASGSLLVPCDNAGETDCVLGTAGEA